MELKTSPFAPEKLPQMPAVAGVQLATAETGIKYKNRPDLLMVMCDEGTHVACVATQSSTASSAVELCRAHAKDGKGRLLLVNAGNANAFTGDAGKQTTAEIMNVCAVLSKADYKQSFMCSTGVIGEPLDSSVIISKLSPLVEGLKSGGWYAAARAIETTDTYPKLATKTVTVNGKDITINGIAKGSGMIAPNMATMLAFFFTDAAIAPDLLQTIFARCAQKSFNSITVDSDTSTSDTGLIFATGKAGNKEFVIESQAQAFEAALLDIMQNLAQQIVRDGEGAQKFITVKVTGAKDEPSAHSIAMSIANSPLVKTAIAGEDANWGRVVMAVGKSGEPVEQSKLTISFGGQVAAKNGQLNPDYDEVISAEHLKGREVELAVDIGIGKGQATVWTCDLTHGYIEINGDYRT